MKEIVFINEDYFPSKTAGGSAKSIYLLTKLFNKIGYNTQVITRPLRFKEINSKRDNIFILNSVATI